LRAEAATGAIPEPERRMNVNDVEFNAMLIYVSRRASR